MEDRPARIFGFAADLVGLATHCMKITHKITSIVVSNFEIDYYRYKLTRASKFPASKVYETRDRSCNFPLKYKKIRSHDKESRNIIFLSRDACASRRISAINLLNP